MKILHVIPSYIPAYRYGGSVKSVHELCKALIKNGVEILVITTNVDWDRKLDVLLNKPVNVEGVDVIYCPVRFMKSYYYSKDLHRLIRENIPKFDIVHIHSAYLYPPFIAARLAHQYKKSYIIHPFGALDPAMIRLKDRIRKSLYIKLIEEKNVKRAAAIHVDSIYERERFLSLRLNVPRVAIIPPSLDLRDYKAVPPLEGLMEKYPQLKGKKIILFLGRIHFKKGFDLLAEAFKIVVGKRKDIYLVIAGPSEGDYADRVKELFVKANVIKYVLFTGMLLGTEKLSAFYSSDIFILSSYGENFGVAVLEAMACGLPVIITNRVGLYPDVKEYKAGLITDCEPEQVADAMLELLDNDNLRKAMGENGRGLTEDRFTCDKVADKMIEVYRAVLKDKE